MIQIHNSLTGRKEALVPIVPGEVRMYLCGDTVYDFCHIGHARSKVAFDVVRRYLAHRGYRVIFVRNITDIDDKIIRRAIENGETIGALTERFITAMHEDFEALGILPPDHEPRATGSIDGIIDLIGTLIEKGHAYAVENGGVYYAVASFPGYGQLSGKRLEDLRAGARVEVDSAKRDPLDFVLWKAVKPGEPSWESPWGQGRPGWHIECSAMAERELGMAFSVHGGGIDLVFPHHENEIAQSECCNSVPFSRHWYHSEHLLVDGTTMSKSKGNYYTLRDLVAKGHEAMALRYALLMGHPRKQLNFTLDSLHAAASALRTLRSVRAAIPGAGGSVDVFAPVLAALQATKSVRNRPASSPSTRPTAVAASAGVEAIWPRGRARKNPALTAR